MRVRSATIIDFPDVRLLLDEFLSESLKDYGVEINKEALNKTMYELVDSCLVLVDNNDKVVGLLAGKVIDEPMSNSKIFQEVIWYVLKKHRKYGIQLLKVMEEWCKRNKISAMVMVHMGNSMPEKLARFYERMGYKHLECHYLKRI